MRPASLPLPLLMISIVLCSSLLAIHPSYQAGSAVQGEGWGDTFPGLTPAQHLALNDSPVTGYVSAQSRVQSTALAVDSSGNAYVTGYFSVSGADFGSTTLSSSGSYDVFVAKLDSSGNWLWAERAGGSDLEQGYGIAVDSSGNAYVTGYFQSSSADFGGTTLNFTFDVGNSIDSFVAKIDSNGNWLWAERAGGSIGYGIAVDSSGNAYVTGYFTGSSADFGSTTLSSSGSYDVFVAKLDSSGNWLWAERAGGSTQEIASGIAVDSSGNAYVTGYFSVSGADFGSTTLSSSGSYDVFVAKLDSSGNWLWAERAGGSDGDSGYGIAVDSSGNAYVTGNFMGTSDFGSTNLTSRGETEIFVAKLDSSGNWLWAERAGGSDYDFVKGIAVDSSGNAYVTGNFMGTSDFGSTNLTSRGETEIFVAKLDSSGNWLWAERAGGSTQETASGIAVDSSGNAYATGWFQGSSADFGSTTLNSTGVRDVFVAKLDSSGNWLWVERAGGSSDETGNGINETGNGIDEIGNGIDETGNGIDETAGFFSNWWTFLLGATIVGMISVGLLMGLRSKRVESRRSIGSIMTGLNDGTLPSEYSSDYSTDQHTQPMNRGKQSGMSTNDFPPNQQFARSQPQVSSTCPHCGFSNSGVSTKCEMCLGSMPRKQVMRAEPSMIKSESEPNHQLRDRSRKCSLCGNSNLSSASVCIICQFPLT